MEETGYIVAFSHHMGVGPHHFDKFVQHFGSVEKAYRAHEDELAPLLGPKTLASFLRFRSKFKIKGILKEIAQKQIHILTRNHPRFPPQLLRLPDTPICLYAKGNLDAIDFANETFFAIVGTRMPTSYGQHVANLFATELASSKIVIVSGMAHGIDAAAHRAALGVRGRTIAFLGCGVDIVYPAANRDIYERIIDDGGLVISEFPPGMHSLPGHFVARNRLVSGISRGVLVVEGTGKSGTLITAKYAADQGVDVYAVPAPINVDQSEAPNMLLKDGAKLVLSPNDILEEFGLRGKANEKTLDLDSFSAEERTILQNLSRESLRIDDIILATGMTAQLVLNKLSLLEVNGVIQKSSEGKYFLNW